jgi:hypothetical protein
MRDYAIAPDFALTLAETIDRERPVTVLESGSGVPTLARFVFRDASGADREGSVVDVHLARR